MLARKGVGPLKNFTPVQILCYAYANNIAATFRYFFTPSGHLRINTVRNEKSQNVSTYKNQDTRDQKKILIKIIVQKKSLLR